MIKVVIKWKTFDPTFKDNKNYFSKSKVVQMKQI